MSEKSTVAPLARGRTVHLDYLRVLSAIFVVTIHVTDALLYNFPRASGEYIYAVAIQAIVRMGVPLFFMISGALLLSRPATAVFDVYATRLTRLLVPLTVYSVMYVGAKNPASLLSLGGWGVFFQKVLAGEVFYHLWFVYALAGIYLLAPLLSLALNKASRGAVAACAVALVLFHCLETYAPYIGLRLGFDFALVGTWFVYFVLGYALSLFTFQGHWKLLTGLALFAIVASALIRQTSDQYSPFDKGLNMYLSSAAVFALAISVSPWLAGHRRLNAMLASLSSRSYGVYLVHALFLNIVLGEHYMLAAHTIGAPYWGVPLLVAVTLGLALPTAWVVDRLVADPLTELVSKGFLRARALLGQLWRGPLVVSGLNRSEEL